MPKNDKKLQSQEKIANLEGRLMRALADYQNLEKRHQTRAAETVKFANQNLLLKFLTVLDDLVRAQEHLNDAGIDLVITNFKQLLSSENITQIEALGQPFDPATMDCIEVVPGPQDQVVTVLTNGFLYHDKVLRPARVEVGSGQV